MTTSKRNLFIVLAFATLAATLVGCSGGGETAAPDQSATTGGKAGETTKDAGEGPAKRVFNMEDQK